MSKPKIPNQKRKYQELNTRLNKYVVLVEQIYDTLNFEAAKIACTTDYDADGKGVFKFSDYPQTSKRVQDLQEQFVNDIGAVVYRGTSEEWKNSNVVQDMLAKKVLGAYDAQVDGEKHLQYFEQNSDAMRAFQNRKDIGMNLSTKLWQQSYDYTSELESAVSCALQKGISAVTLSKQLSQYLKDFKSLQKDYKERFGEAANIKDCEYRSIRLARSEINMAYRSAENERWKQMDFVVGFEIKTTQNGKHVADICDELKGEYPKDFEWTGWHPNCMCYKIPILKTEEEFWELDGRDEVTTESVNEVKDVPENFKKWINGRTFDISKAEVNSSLPYFIRDNKSVVAPLLNPKNDLLIPKATPLDDVYASFMRMAKKWDGIISLNEAALNSYQSVLGKANIEELINEFDGIVSIHGCSLTKIKLESWLKNNITLEVKGLSKSNEEIKLTRVFRIDDNGERTVIHSLFVLPPELQGKGISKQTFRALYKQYVAADVDNIELHANITVGGYTWGRYGFCTTKSEALGAAMFRNEPLSNKFKEIISDFYKSHDDDKLFPMNLITNVDGAKDFLTARKGESKGVSWFGTLKLKDKKQLRLFVDYVFGSKR